MPRFDVHRNPGRTRAAIPFVLVVQGGRWKDRAAIDAMIAQGQ